MQVGDQVRASYPYGGVPKCNGNIIREMVLGKRTQFLVRFEVRSQVFKEFYLTARELTLCAAPETQEPLPLLPLAQSGDSRQR